MFLLLTPTQVESIIVETPVEQVNPLDSLSTQDLIYHYADMYGVSRSAMLATVRNETAGTFDTNIQSYVQYKSINPRWLTNCPGLSAGDRERSYGLAQIHVCDHNVTVEQATDPQFALDFMARNFAKGNQGWWMGYSDY